MNIDKHIKLATPSSEDLRPIKVKVNRLNKSFGDLKVLEDINFDIKRNEFLCIVGPTGCGKTTFLNLLTKIYEPTSGEILIGGEPADPKKHNLSFVFQEPSAMPWLTVEENIAFGLEIKELPKEEIKKRVDHIINLMGLKDVRKSYPNELSVSVEQRIIIGRSFAMQPDLLLESTVVFITHNIEEAVYLAERVLILSQKPATIKEEVIINLPHPRDVTSPEFIKYRNYITDQIKWW